MKQPLTLILAMLIGAVFPFFEHFVPLVPYLLGTMLFFSFLKAKIEWSIFTEKKIYFLLIANIAIGIIAYYAVLPFSQELAFIAFLIGMIPTALAAPAMVSILNGNIAFTVACVMVTNFSICVLLPFISSFISPVSFSSMQMMIHIALLLSIPFVTSQGIHTYAPHISQKIEKHSSLVFYLWASIIIISIARASAFLRENWDQYAVFIFPIACIAGILCIINFTVGFYIGGKEYSEEASQSLGQKNPMLMIWVAIEFFTPLSALGPTFYIFFHHMVNAWKLMKNKKNVKMN